MILLIYIGIGVGITLVRDDHYNVEDFVMLTIAWPFVILEPVGDVLVDAMESVFDMVSDLFDWVIDNTIDRFDGSRDITIQSRGDLDKVVVKELSEADLLKKNSLD